jgi:hypothetical protein
LTSTRAIPDEASAWAHRFYPQTTGLKLVTRQHEIRRRREVSAVRPGKVRDGRVKSIVPGSFGVTLADEIAMSDENDGILGNLPRSRPGVRSDKRASSAGAGGPGGSAGSPPAPKPKPATKPKAAAKPKAPRKAAPPPPPPPEREPAPEPVERSADPVGMALKAGETLAVTGIKVAGRVASEVLRRLPRP